MTDRLASHRDAAKASHTNDYADVEAGTNRYEMARISSSKLKYMDKDQFLSEVKSATSELQRFNDNVALISKLQDRSLNSISDPNIQEQMDRAIQETSAMMNSLRDQIKSLQAQGGNNDVNKFRREHAERLRQRFNQTLNDYQQAEKQHRDKQKERMARQFGIVNKDASPQEVQAFLESGNGQQVFQQALMNPRFGQATSTYLHVQERNEDLRKVEQSIAELADMINIMAMCVEEHGDKIDVIVKNTEEVRDNTHAAMNATENAKRSAERARRMKKIGFGIVVVILIILALVLGLYFGAFRRPN